MKGFLVWWGSKKGTLTLKDVELNVAVCPVCDKPTRINLMYHVTAHGVYSIYGKGSVDDVSILCLNCGCSFETKLNLRLAALKLLQDNIKGKESEFPDVKGAIEETNKEIAFVENERKEAEDAKRSAIEEEKKRNLRQKERDKKIRNAKTAWQKIRARI